MVYLETDNAASNLLRSEAVLWRRRECFRQDREYLFRAFPTFGWLVVTGLRHRARIVRHAADPHQQPKEMHRSFRPAPAYMTEDEAIRHLERHQGSAGWAWSRLVDSRTFSEIPGLCSNTLRLWQNPRRQ